jgi:hypothetical protein
MFGGAGGDGLMRGMLALLALSSLGACSRPSDVNDQTAEFSKHVNSNKLGVDKDVWIEMKNMAGQWEKTALVFGYVGDFEECEKMAAGLKKVNFAREYRCVPADQK